MNTFNSMLESVSIRFASTIKNNCAPLQNFFGIKHYSYCQISTSGDFSFLTNYPDWMGYYFTEKFHLLQPHFRHPRYFSSGISFPRTIENLPYQQALQIAQKKFSLFPGLVFIERTAECVTFNAFDLKNSHPAAEQALINDIPLLKKFSRQFQEQNTPLFRALQESQVKIADILGTDFFTFHTPVLSRLENRRQLIATLCLGTNVVLTDKEKGLLGILQYGESASIIAHKMFRSKRTIEKSLDRLREKLHLSSRKELVDKAKELHTLGYFDAF